MSYEFNIKVTPNQNYIFPTVILLILIILHNHSFINIK